MLQFKRRLFRGKPCEDSNLSRFISALQLIKKVSARILNVLARELNPAVCERGYTQRGVSIGFSAEVVF